MKSICCYNFNKVSGFSVALFRSKAKGIAALEAALMFAVLLPIMAGAFALADYVHMAMLLRDVVDKQVYDNGVKPLLFKLDGGNSSLALNDAELQQYVERIGLGVEEQIKSRILGETSDTNYRIELKVVELEIDKNLGKVKGAPKERSQFNRSFGALSVPFKSEERTDLMQLIRDESDALDRLDGPSGLASPSGVFNSSAPQYLGKTVLVGARAFVALSGLSGYVQRAFGTDPVIYDAKVVHLRGDVATK